MGFNTTVVVLNDALHLIEKDQNFGKNLVAAIGKLQAGRPYPDVSIGHHCNAATVIETHHADCDAIIAVGGNCGHVLGYAVGVVSNGDSGKVEILKQLAEQLGYRLVRKSKVKEIQ